MVPGRFPALRRGSASRTTVDWIATVGAYALGGVVILLLGTVVFSVQVSGLGGSGSAGVTPWTVAVLAAWGAAIEVVARYLAPGAEFTKDFANSRDRPIRFSSPSRHTGVKDLRLSIPADCST